MNSTNQAAAQRLENGIFGVQEKGMGHADQGIANR